MKRLITLLITSLLLTGCTTYNDGSSAISLFAPKGLAQLKDEPITIDITEDFDPNTVLEKIQEGTEVSYELNEDTSELTITLVKDDKSETLTTPVTIVYPGVDIPDDITIDTYTGYDINEIVDADDDVTVTSELNEETGELTITYSKGNYTNTITKEVELTNSDPWAGIFPGTFHFNRTIAKGFSYQPNDWYTFNEDGTIIIVDENGKTYTDEWYDIIEKTDEEIHIKVNWYEADTEEDYNAGNFHVTNFGDTYITRDGHIKMEYGKSMQGPIYFINY